MRNDLSGRSALVTGATGGIGVEVCRALLAEGAGVVVGDLDEQRCQEVAAKLNAEAGESGRAVARRIDVTSQADWDAFLRCARRYFRYPTVLVNAAGTLDIHGLEGVTEENWSRVVDVCQRGVWLGMRTVVPAMHLAGHGAVVNVCSVFAHVGSRAAFAYHAAKGAVHAMTRAAAVELAPAGIRVNSVCPGMIGTPLTDRLPEQFVADYVAATPMARLGTVTDVAEAVVFLASDRSSFVTGTELVVDGGYTAA